MKDSRSVWYLLLAGFVLAACAGKTLNIFGDNEPAYVQGTDASGRTPSPASPDELPAVRGEAGVPMPDQVAVKEQGMVIGKVFDSRTASLDTRKYDAGAGLVFSSVIDAMTALNMAIQSVDSPTGAITTEWVFQDANSESITLTEGKTRPERYRFTVRVRRLKASGKTQLEIRTLGQALIKQHWVNRPIKRKVSVELFGAVEEQLARRALKKADQGALIKPAH